MIFKLDQPAPKSMELRVAAACAPEFPWARRTFFLGRRALNFPTHQHSNCFDTSHFKTSFPNLRMSQAPCGYRYSIQVLMGSRPPPNRTVRVLCACACQPRHYRPPPLPLPMGQGRTGLRATLLACAYAKAGPGWRRVACGVQARSASRSVAHVHSQAARGWLGVLAPPPYRPRALRPVAAARMPLPLNIMGTAALARGAGNFNANPPALPLAWSRKCA